MVQKKSPTVEIGWIEWETYEMPYHSVTIQIFFIINWAYF